MTRALTRILVMVLLAVAVLSASQAAERDGMQVPDRRQADGKTLSLNGFGRRTATLLHIHVYVASLYLEHPGSDAEAILRSPETKLLVVKFDRDVSEEDARKAWRIGLYNNCVAPCRLDPQDVAEFLDHVQASREGDEADLLFTRNGATVTVNGQRVGTITKRSFADAVLAVFLGPNPASPELRQALLAGHP